MPRSRSGARGWLPWLLWLARTSSRFLCQRQRSSVDGDPPGWDEAQFSSEFRVWQLNFSWFELVWCFKKWARIPHISKDKALKGCHGPANIFWPCPRCTAWTHRTESEAWEGIFLVPKTSLGRPNNCGIYMDIPWIYHDNPRYAPSHPISIFHLNWRLHFTYLYISLYICAIRFISEVYTIWCCSSLQKQLPVIVSLSRQGCSSSVIWRWAKYGTRGCICHWHRRSLGQKKFSVWIGTRLQILQILQILHIHPNVQLYTALVLWQNWFKKA